jgi:polyisoprenoid-binding protein YceI
MKRTRALMILTTLYAVSMIFAGSASKVLAQAPAPPASGARLEIVDGSTASYRVQEQLAGVNFPNDAVGITPSVTGTLAINPDGSVDSAQSKLTIDLRNLKSDQDMRDGYIQKRTLETDKFPMAEFVPKRIQGLPSPLPTMGQAGFQLTGDMTIHGKTSEITWTGVATFNKDQVAGRGTTNFTFATFGLTKPTLARLLSVDDKIQLEVVFKFKRS